MGIQINESYLSHESEVEFNRLLRKETAILAECFREHRFDPLDSPYRMGMEIEAWIVDEDLMPNPINVELLARLDDPLVVPELSKFNIELNSKPLDLNGDCFGRAHNTLTELSARAQSVAKELKSRILTIGTLPTLRDHMLTIDYLSDFDRYRALNARVLAMRGGQPIRLGIDGVDSLQVQHQDIMLEAATTSFQVHFQVPIEQSVSHHNAAVAMSFATVAVSANSPLFLGSDLWDETRIPVFEQAVNLSSYRTFEGRLAKRVTFGDRYVQKSIFELFLDNLDGYPLLIANLMEADPRSLKHLCFHNGTIWRWNRPIVNIGSGGLPQLRLEHRVMASGPTSVDMIANMMFSIGLIHAHADSWQHLNESIPFAKAEANFYAAARDGLRASVFWNGREGVSLSSLVLEELIPMARAGLENLGIDHEDITCYLDDVMIPRVLSGQTGAAWQRSYISVNGRDWQGLVACYLKNQELDNPVHQWNV